jgi:tyrosyl-tRNA synthetase
LGALLASALVARPAHGGRELRSTASTLSPAVTNQLVALERGAHTLFSRDELARRLERSAEGERPLRVKFGVDPSRPDLHLGHAVPLRKLRQFQDLGHTAVLIIGDFTGRVGDPSGRSETRPMLSEDEIRSNAQTYFDQAGRVLDMDGAEVRWNSQWLGDMTMADVLRLTSSYTVAKMLERDDFRGRHEAHEPISVVEFLYPLMQAMDSVAVEADVELGGTDQTFNLLVGREIQRAYGQEPQVVLTMPLLVGTDGKRKMSKSFDNYVAFTDSEADMFGKAMSIPDEALDEWEALASGLNPEELPAVALARDDMPEAARRKRRLAKAVVASFHGWDAADRQERAFDAVHRRGELPEDAPAARIPDETVKDGKVWLPRLLVALGLAGSNSDARRKLGEGAVRLDGQRLDDPEAELDRSALSGRILQVGRARFVRLEP